MRADARRNRAALLDAASRLFAEHGLGVSVAEIAEDADVTVATLHRHFPTKHDLYEAISIERSRVVEELVERALATDDVGEALVGVFQDIVAMQARDRGLVQLIEATISTDLHLQMIGRWESLIHRAQAAGRVRADITAEDIPFLLAAGGGLARMLTDASPALRRRYARLLADTLRCGNETPLGSSPPSAHQVVAAYASAQVDVL